MVIDIVRQDAEQRLLSLIEREGQQNNWGVLHFQSSRLLSTPSEDDVLRTVRPALEDKHAAIYLFHDGDIVITWSGLLKATLESLSSRLYDRYSPDREQELHHYYDWQAQGEDIRLLCYQKIQYMPAYISVPDSGRARPSTLKPPTPAQQKIFNAALEARAKRKGMEIMVVEDQLFSRKLLLSLLGRLFKTCSAADAETALELYYSEAPDMVFLDIELPGVSGHELAAAVQKLDPQSYIVMVTANHLLEDVERARENGARGFIAKPYSKGKIMRSIEEYITQYKLKP